LRKLICAAHPILRLRIHHETTGMIARAKETRPLLVLAGLTVISLAVLALLPPIPQDQGYHAFADARAFLGVPNFWNVVSNLPFVAIGAIGLWQFHRDPTTIALFGGMLLTGIGSSYYHWAPSDGTLFWDRLPITLTFMAATAAVIEERVDARLGALLLWPLLALGLVSMLVWRWTDDLRFYGWVQFFPCIALPLLLLLCPAKYTGTYYWFIAFGWYAVSKLTEYSDRAIFSVGSIVSGHTIKHLAAAAACYAILRYFQTRRPIV
jgi:hypothetical protein